MSESPIPLTRQQRLRLLDALEQIGVLNTQQNRDLLLSDLPDRLCNNLPRSAVTVTDLTEIVKAAELWGLLEDGTPALHYVIENALRLSRGSAAGQQLRALYQDLQQPATALTLASETDIAPKHLRPVVAPAKAQQHIIELDKLIKESQVLEGAMLGIQIAPYPMLEEPAWLTDRQMREIFDRYQKWFVASFVLLPPDLQERFRAEAPYITMFLNYPRGVRQSMGSRFGKLLGRNSPPTYDWVYPYESHFRAPIREQREILWEAYNWLRYSLPTESASKD